LLSVRGKRLVAEPGYKYAEMKDLPQRPYTTSSCAQALAPNGAGSDRRLQKSGELVTRTVRQFWYPILAAHK
jgi:hypothetical protein